MTQTKLLSLPESMLIKNDTTGCINWSGSKDKNGYGLFSNGQGNDARVHRIAYRIAFGEIPEGKIVRHKCDNPCCCNIDHLELGDVKTNNQDRVKRGRSNNGENNGQAKITSVEILFIRRSKASNDWLSYIFGISATQIGRIRRNEQWQNIAHNQADMPEWMQRINDLIPESKKRKNLA
jgi:hypothetical protein